MSTRDKWTSHREQMTIEVASQVKKRQQRSVEEKPRIVEETLASFRFGSGQNDTRPPYQGIVVPKVMRARNDRASWFCKSVMRTAGCTALTLFERFLGFVEFLSVAFKFR